MKLQKAFRVLCSVALILCLTTGCADTKAVDCAQVTVTLTESQAQYEANAKAIVNEYVALRLSLMQLGDAEKWDSKTAVSAAVGELQTRLSALDTAITALDRASDTVAATSASAEKQAILKKGANPLTLTASAAESTRRAIDWAEEITNAYDSYPTGKQLKGLAAYLGTDCKTALKKLEVAQGIMANEYENEAQMWDDLKDVATGIQATCKVELFLGGLATGNPETLTEAGLLLINGVDTLLAVGTGGAEIVLGEDARFTAYMNTLKDAFAPISSVTGLLTFNSADTSAADRITYIGDSLNDLIFDGKLFGGAITVSEISSVLSGKTYDSVEEMEQDGFEVPAETATFALAPETVQDVTAPVLAREDVASDIAAAETALAALERTAETTVNTTTPQTTQKPTQKNATSIDNLCGEYRFTELRLIQGGTSSKDVGTGTVSWNGSKLSLLSHMNGEDDEDEPALFDFDPATLTGKGSNQNMSMTIQFDGQGHFLYSVVNDKDGLTYIEIDATKID